MPEVSIEQKSFKITVAIASLTLIFVITAVGGAAAWAQNMTNHLANVDGSLVEMKDSIKKIQDMNVLQDRTQRMDERLRDLEVWRLKEAEIRGR